MIKVSRNDPFDLNLCMRGLGVMMTYMHSDLYEFMYYLTFKRTMKSYSQEFNDAWAQGIEEIDFFEKTDDPFVKNCTHAHNSIADAKMELVVRFGIDEVEDLEDEEMVLQSTRFRPYFLLYKRSKSYKKLKLYYERTLTGFIECLYWYACALTARSYKIPLVLKRQLALPDDESLRLLNQDDNNVELLKELISELQKDLQELKTLNIKKPVKK